MLTIVALYMISSHAQLALCLSVLFFSTWYAVHLEKKKIVVINKYNVIRTSSTELLMLSCLHILKAYLLTRRLTQAFFFFPSIVEKSQVVYFS